MRPVQVILQVFLVAAGLVAYDHVRGRDSDGASHERAHHEPARPVPGPTLGGDPGGELPTLRRQVARLERRMAELAERGASDRPPDAGAETVRRGAAAPRLPAARAIEVPAPPPIADARFDPGEIARFRALQDAARRQERLERVRDRAGRLLDQGPGGRLSAREHRLVLEESLRAWLRAREIGPIRPAEAQSASRRLHADFLEAVRRIVPESRADAIVEKLSPMLGLIPAEFAHDGGEEGR